MKKINRIIIGIILLLILALCFLITFDCVRLKDNTELSKPVFSFKETVTSNRVTYYGLGYTVQYYCNNVIKAENLITCDVYGAEFKVLNKILIWAWVS